MECVPVWLHSSPNEIPNGDWVIAPNDSGRPPHWTGDPATLKRAEDCGFYRRDRVYIFDAEGAPTKDHVNRFAFIPPSSYVYEFEPDGEIELDPDPVAQSSFRSCRRARVIGCHHRPIG